MTSIGNRTLSTNVFLAPMSGCTDLAFRLIAREHGAAFAFFEMIDSHSVFYHRKKTYSLLKTLSEDAPIALQLLGADPDIMLKAARDILSMIDISFVDINAACPAKKVVRRKAGSYLLEDRDALYRIIGTLTSSLSVPVTAKIRLGYQNETLQDIIGLAKRCEGTGASALFVHGRTRLQQYSGEIDYGAIKAIKESVRIPVFGSGNILSPHEAKTMFDLTGCDGILVARGALGNPWIFKGIEKHLACGEAAVKPSLADRKDVLKRHLSYIERHSDCRPAVRVGIMRKVAFWYLKSFPNARRIREKICVVNDYEKMLEFIDSIGDI